AAARGKWGGQGEERMTEFGMVMQKLVEMDPRRAMDYAKEQKQIGEGQFAALTAMRTWARTDSDAALKWALDEWATMFPPENWEAGNKLPRGENPAVIAVLEQLAKTNLKKALETASREIGRPVSIPKDTNTFISGTTITPDSMVRTGTTLQSQ